MIIESVKLVSGIPFNSRWTNKIQLIQTDEGEFIDSLPNTDYKINRHGKPGYDWTLEIGKELVKNIDFHTVDNSHYIWLKYGPDR